MQKTKIVNISLLAILLAITLSIPILSVQANPSGGYFQQRQIIINSLITGEQRICTNAEVFIGDTNYMIFGIGNKEEEREQHLCLRPYSWSVLLDGEVEVEFSRLWWYDKNGEVLGDGIPVFWTIFYHIYEPYSLELGEHKMDHEISFYEGAFPNREQIVWTWISYFWVIS